MTPEQIEKLKAVRAESLALLAPDDWRSGRLLFIINTCNTLIAEQEKGSCDDEGCPHYGSSHWHHITGTPSQQQPATFSPQLQNDHGVEVIGQPASSLVDHIKRIAVRGSETERSWLYVNLGLAVDAIRQHAREGDVEAGARAISTREMQVLAEYHHCQAAGAEAMGYDECVPHHENRAKELEACIAAATSPQAGQ